MFALKAAQVPGCHSHNLFAPKLAVLILFISLSRAREKQNANTEKKTVSAMLNYKHLFLIEPVAEMRERDANILQRFIASFSVLFLFWQRRNPSWHTACAIQYKKTANFVTLPLPSIEFSPICSVENFKDQLRTHPGTFAKIHPLLLCGSIPAESEPRRKWSRAILQKFITAGCELGWVSVCFVFALNFCECCLLGWVSTDRRARSRHIPACLPVTILIHCES